MQFDMCHALASAALWEPSFVLASIAWAAFLAYLWSMRRKDRSMWKAIALAILATPVAAGLLANVTALSSMASCSVGYMGRGVWMAVPLAIPFVVLRLLQPKVDRIAIAARTVAFLVCLHAGWTVSLFPDDIAKEVGPKSLIGLEGRVAHAPWVALAGVAPMLLVYVLLERGAGAGSWRAWISVRLQLILASIGLVAELRIASLSTVFDHSPPSPMIAPIIFLAAIFAVQARLKSKTDLTQPRAGAT